MKLSRVESILTISGDGNYYLSPHFIMFRKWKVLQSVQDRNETLFYRLLMDNFLEVLLESLFYFKKHNPSDGPHYLHSHSRMGLLPFLSSLQVMPRTYRIIDPWFLGSI